MELFIVLQHVKNKLDARKKEPAKETNCFYVSDFSFEFLVFCMILGVLCAGSDTHRW